MSSSVSAVIGTPSRDRHPTSASYSSPVSSRPAASSSTISLTNTSTTTIAPTTQPVTLESLLHTHASSPNPTLAALEQALAERNLLSTQNAQLWKLIEKQRTGYGQVLKELERVRGERDTYRTRLQSAGLNGDLPKKEKHKDGERLPRASSSSSPMVNTSSNGSISLDSRPSLTERRSDDIVNPRSHSTQLHASNSQESLITRDASRSQSAPQKTSRTAVVPPLVVPPRLATLPTISPSSAIVSPDNQTPSSALAEKVSAERDDSTPVTSMSQVNGMVNGAVPALTLRKTSVPEGGVTHTQESFSQQHTSASPYSSLPSSSHSAKSEEIRSEGVLPSGFPQQKPSIVASSSASSGVPLSMQPGSLASLSPRQSTVNTGLLSPVIEDARHPGTSRDSRISLPDEAKRYIATMGESPVPSPKVNQFGTQPSSELSRYQIDATITGHPLTREPDSLAVEASTSTLDEFLDMEDDDTPDDEVTEEVQKGPVVRHFELTAADGFPLPPSYTDDFPLPPSYGRPQYSDQSQLQIHMRTTPSREDSQSTVLPKLNVQPAGDWQERPFSADPMSPASYFSQPHSTHPVSSSSSPTHSFRALPLVPDDLRSTEIQVSHTSIRPNDRGKEVLSFEVEVRPGHGKEPWKVEKLFSDVLGLDHRVRANLRKEVGKKIATLPEGKLWRDHAPAKVDQRKVALEAYLQSLISLPVKDKTEVIAFLTSDIVRDTRKPVSQPGYKEGYLTKRGKNFRGWKSRYFVLEGPMLEYYESRGGAHLGSINITGAQIGRQQRSNDPDDEKDYRHAFLIIEAKKGAASSNSRHVLCAESDSERDSWVEVLVHSVMGSRTEDPMPSTAGPGLTSHSSSSGQTDISAPRSSTSSYQGSENPYVTPNGKRVVGRPASRDDVAPRSSGGPAASSQLTPDARIKPYFSAPLVEEPRGASPIRSITPSPVERPGQAYFSPEDTARRLLDRSAHSNSLDVPLSSSLPTTSPIEGASSTFGPVERANSELGHYRDMQGRGTGHTRHDQPSPERSREPPRDRKSYHHTVHAATSPGPGHDGSSSPDSVQTPARADVNGKVKISGPIHGAPIPAGYNFGGKDMPPESIPSSSDRREKAKSRSFWGFGRPHEKPSAAPSSKVVFGVPLEESLEVAQIASLPAVVFRCIQYLEAKKAEQEEGIYRLNGSSAVIKNLKDRFNAEGDVDLMGSDEYWDPHAIAGVLKSYLRDLPASILTHDLHLRFLSVIDLVDSQERIKELSNLIASLPIANYSLLRALTAHLILIVQYANVNKMTMRNLGIVFSPTLGIPAGVFSLMLGEFNRVFNVDAGNEDADTEPQDEGEGLLSPDRPSGNLSRRNSRRYSDMAADQLLGLSGRTLDAPPDDAQSDDGDSLSAPYESGTETTENEATVESTTTRSSAGAGSSQHTPSHHQPSTELLYPPDAEGDSNSSTPRSHASTVAASRGLNIAVSQKGNRHSRVFGLPASPRPPVSPSPRPSPHGPNPPMSPLPSLRP